MPLDKAVNHKARYLLPDSRSQIPTLFDCIRDGAGRKWGTRVGDILGQAAKYCRVIHPIKMSFEQLNKLLFDFQSNQDARTPPPPPRLTRKLLVKVRVSRKKIAFFFFHRLIPPTGNMGGRKRVKSDKTDVPIFLASDLDLCPPPFSQ